MNFTPNIISDITSSINDKKSAMSCYQEFSKSSGHYSIENVLHINKTMGLPFGFNFAEGFKIEQACLQFYS